jgi:3-hydroxy-9,10-secoandrosta-1,3,5(10)-triene-9,17-dione monooxygenase
MAAEESSPAIVAPEPDLTPEDLFDRARAMQPLLRQEQARTQERGTPAPEAHEQLLRSGLYRIIQPRRYGGYEFSFEDSLKAVIEISRGCPSTGWHYAFMAEHGMLLSTMFEEEAQAASFGPDGDFLAPGRIPMGTATPVDDGWIVDGTWDYCSGAPYATHFLPSVLIPSPGGPPVIGTAVLPRAQWTMLDDWGGGLLGLAGSGSNSIKVDKQLIPSWAVVQRNPIALDVSTPPPGYELHGNPLYAGRLLSLLVAELGAWSVGVAWAMLDEYEQMMRTRQTMFPPKVMRFEHHDYLRNYGLALGYIDAAEAVVTRAAQLHLEFSKRGVDGGESFSAEDDARLMSRYQHAFQLSWQAVDLLFRTGGTSAAMRDSHAQRYYRDFSMARTHIGQQLESAAEGLARCHFGLASMHG